MCILRYTPTTRPSASITAALLWYSPGARRSNTGAITTMPACRAARPNASVLGPGTGSARSNRAASSRCAKYCERNSSGRHTRRAPARAASATFVIACSRFAAGSADIAICTSPMVYFVGGEVSLMGENSTSGIDDLERRFHLVVRNPAQGHVRDVAPGDRSGVGGDRDEAAKQSAQPDHDAFAIGRGGGQGRMPVTLVALALPPHTDTHDVVGWKHKVQLCLAVIVNRVHQPGLHARRLAIAGTPCEPVGDGGEGHDRQLREGKLDRGSLCAGGLQRP